MSENQRQHLRYPIAGRAQLSVGEPPRPVDVRMIDISVSGASFLSDVAFPVGTRGSLAVSTLGEKGPVFAAANFSVRYCVLEKRMYRVGGLFIDVDAAVQRGVDAIVSARARSVKGR